MPHHTLLISLLSLSILLSGCNAAAPSAQILATTQLVVVTPVGQTATASPGCFVASGDPFAFTPDSQRILVRSEPGVQIFNLQNMLKEKFVPAPAKSTDPAIALSPDGETLAWALSDHSIQLIRLSDNTVIKTLKGHTGMVTKLKFSLDGKKLFSASHDTWVRIWDSSGDSIGRFQPLAADNLPSEVLGMGVLPPDGSIIATIPLDGPVKLSGNQVSQYLGGSGGYDTSDIAFSADGELVAADLATGLFLWRRSDGTQLLGGNPGINSMAVVFSPDGRYLAYGEITDKSSIVLSSPDGGLKVRRLEGFQGPVWELVFSPDSSLLASADEAEIRIWRVQDGRLLWTGKNICP